MKYKIRENRFNAKSKIKLQHIQKIIDEAGIVSVRQLHYALSVAELAPNTKGSYQAASRLCTLGRYAGILDWDAIEDGTRGAYKTTSWENVDQAIQNTLENYRKDRWKDSPYYVEVWVEKRTMINLFYFITNKYDVHLISGGGFNSASAIWEAVRRLMPKQKKKIIILYYGDFDPSGDFMNEDVENRLKEFGLDVKVNRILLNLKHIDEYDLKPSFEVKSKKKNGEVYDKLKADPRAKRFIEKYGKLRQVEIEAMNPAILKNIIEENILLYFDEKLNSKVIRQEKKEIREIENLLGYENEKQNKEEK